MQDFFLYLSLSPPLVSVSPLGIISIMYFNGGLFSSLQVCKDTLVYYMVTTTVLEPQNSTPILLSCPALPDYLHGDNMFAHVMKWNHSGSEVYY